MLHARWRVVADRGPVVVLGGFDGFHLGHRHRVAVARTIAEKGATQLVGIVVDNCRPWLMAPEDRCSAVLRAGAGSVFACRLDPHGASTVVEAFGDMITDRLTPSLVVIGAADAGQTTEPGIPDRLRRAFDSAGVAVEVIESPAGQGAEAVTTGLLGQYVARGSLDRYLAVSSSPYSITGVVERGDQRGRTIGFPTANIRPNLRQRLPPNGVYAGIVRVDGRDCVSAINIGLRPTFYSRATHPLLEAHLIDYDGDLYDRRLTVELRTRLRGERRFESVHDLTEQLHQDVVSATLLGATWSGNAHHS